MHCVRSCTDGRTGNPYLYRFQELLCQKASERGTFRCECSTGFRAAHLPEPAWLPSASSCEVQALPLAKRRRAIAPGGSAKRCGWSLATGGRSLWATGVSNIRWAMRPFSAAASASADAYAGTNNYRLREAIGEIPPWLHIRPRMPELQVPRTASGHGTTRSPSILT